MIPPAYRACVAAMRVPGLATLSLLAVAAAHAQVAIVSGSAGPAQVSVSGVYVQQFNSLPVSGTTSWANQASLPGWLATQGPGDVMGDATAFEQIVASYPYPLNTNPGTLYSVPQHFEDNVPTSTYRALAAAPSVSTGPMHLGLRLKNNTNQRISGFQVAYEVRFGYSQDLVLVNGTNTYPLVNGTNNVTLSYRKFAAGTGSLTGAPTGWTTANVKTIVNKTTGSVPDDWTYVIQNITGIGIDPGDEIWLDWQISWIGGSSFITALDNVSVGPFATGNVAFLKQPLPLSVLLGNSFTLEALATASTTVAYQWNKNGIPIVGATNSTLSVISAQGSDTGQYTVVATSGTDTLSSAQAKVKVYTALGVKGPATSGTANALVSGTLATPSVIYTGDDSLRNIGYLPVTRSEKADIYLPNPMPASLCPAIVLIHGGGGNDGDKDDVREIKTAQELARHGYVVMSIDYKRSFSLGGGKWSVAWPQNVKDAKSAVRFLRANAAVYNIDPNRIGALGYSWGGNEAAMLATTTPADGLEPVDDFSASISSAVACATNFYGAVSITDYHNMNQFGGGTNTDPGSMDYTAGTNNYLSASPVTRAHPLAAPLFLSHGDADLEVMPTQNTLLQAALLNAGAPVHGFLLVPRGKHSHALYDTGYGGSTSNPIDVRPQAIGFYDKYLAGPNYSPVANPDTASTNYATSVDIAVVANDTDPNGDALAVLSFTSPSHGSLSDLGNGSLRYTPDARFAGTDAFTYTVQDGNGAVSSSTVQVSVNSTLNRTVATEAVIDSGSASTDFNEVTAGYVTTKYSSGLTSARKTYFQFDLSDADVNPESSGTFTINFNNTYSQSVQLWGLNQAYPSFSSSITWNNAQANDTGSNSMLTSGSLTATRIGSNTNIVPGSSPYQPYSFVIPRVGDFLKNGKVTLVLAGEPALTGSNHSSGLRLTRNSSTLQLNVNTAPTITPIANQALGVNASTGLLAFTIADAETAGGSLQLSFTSSNPALVSDGELALGGSGTNRTLIVTPKPNTTGTTLISVTVSDGTASTSTSFSVTVTATARQNWWIQQFGTATPSGSSAFEADADNDGLSNLLEYSQGANPNSPDSPLVVPVLGKEGSNVTLTYRKSAPELLYVVQKSADLTSGWTTATGIERLNPDGTYTFSVPTESVDKLFLRLRVTLP